MKWIPISSYFEVGTVLDFPRLLGKSNEFRYWLHENIGHKKTGYTDFEHREILVNGSLRDIFVEVEVKEPLTRLSGGTKELSLDFVSRLVEKAVTSDWFDAIWEMNYHGIEVRISEKQYKKWQKQQLG